MTSYKKGKEFSKMSLDERQKLADSCYKKMGWIENFKKTWNNAKNNNEND